MLSTRNTPTYGEVLLAINNIRDMHTDVNVGKNTLPVGLRCKLHPGLKAPPGFKF